MSEDHPQSDVRDPQVIIVGFGVPGRMITNSLIARQIPFTVIELNRATVRRCASAGLKILGGDARDPDLLRQAGIDRAAILAITIPDDTAMLEVVEQVRQLNPSIRIIARCAYTSAGLEAHRRGADEAVVAEQAVARDITHLIEARLNRPPAP